MLSKARPTKEKRQLPLVCLRDGKVMTLVRVTPKLGAMPELRTYRCEHCGAVETVEVRPPVAVDT